MPMLLLLLLLLLFLLLMVYRVFCWTACEALEFITCVVYRYRWYTTTCVIWNLEHLSMLDCTRTSTTLVVVFMSIEVVITCMCVCH